jgi:tripartite-type tricarboxylate transporter receptor subunit TctC
MTCRSYPSTLKGEVHDYYLAGEPFAAFLKEEQARVGEVLRSVGLVKS